MRAVGVVEDTGLGVNKVEIGDKVVVGWINGMGLDCNPPSFSKSFGKINAGKCTTFSNYTVVAENKLTKLPSGFPVNLAALLGCALPTGGGIVLNEITVNPKDKVLIVGLGGIGMSALLTLEALGVKEILCVDKDKKKLATARRLVNCETLAVTSNNKDEILNQLRGLKRFNGGFDYAIEAAGLTSTIELAFEALNKNGSLVFASHPKHNSKIALDPFDLISGKSITGTWGGNSLPDEIIPRFSKLFDKKHEKLGVLVTHYKGLNLLNNAISDLRKNKIVRAVIEIN